MKGRDNGGSPKINRSSLQDIVDESIGAVLCISALFLPTQQGGGEGGGERPVACGEESPTLEFYLSVSDVASTLMLQAAAGTLTQECKCICRPPCYGTGLSARHKAGWLNLGDG